MFPSAARFVRLPVLFIKEREVVDSNRERDVWDEMYSVRRKKETPESENLGFPSVESGRSRARSCGWGTGGCKGAWIAIDNQLAIALGEVFRFIIQLSSPSNIPGMPTKSNGIPSSASASMLSG